MNKDPRGSKYILSLDEGTTNCKASIWNEQGKMVSSAHIHLELSFPQNGWVEANPERMWENQINAAREAIRKSGIETDQLIAIGIANQRETTLIWDEHGIPVYPAIIWQDRRTSDYVKSMDEDTSFEVSEITGLIPDPYFSATKIKWICDYIKSNKRDVNRLFAGTVDSWLMYKLTGGKYHVTDYSNASRTMLFDIRKGEWSGEAMDIFGIDEELLPDVIYSQGGDIVTSREIFGKELPVLAIMGDQQASLYGHLAHNKGEMKNTYGTGSFFLQNNGTDPSRRGRLITSIAWKTEGNPTIYSVEGNAFNTGSVVDWIRKGLHAEDDYQDNEERTNPDHSLYFVPALTGLGAPFWEPNARGTIFGITGATREEDILRSALESIAYRIRDIVEELTNTGGVIGDTLAVDGGLTENDYLMQFQADILGLKIIKPQNHEATSAGAAYMAGVASGIWDYSFLKSKEEPAKEYIPKMEKASSDRLYEGWLKAVNSAIDYYRIKGK